ncbi:MAG: DUF4349 domain-containing protein [Nocardioides sp.]|uniref:DUF4349 domain-containing protein n=1 Tax=Nocardioides sp. TaxID=35761 RepID=UPI0039E4948E
MRRRSQDLRRRAARPVPLAFASLLTALLLVGCSAQGGGAESDAAGGSTDTAAGENAPVPAEADAAMSTIARKNAVDKPALNASYVISTGSVSLSGKDVADLRFDVQEVLDRHRARVDKDETDTGDDNAVIRSRTVFRVPVDEFDDAMDELEKLSGLTASSRESEDVTTQVIDTDVRVKSQEKSIERIRILLDRAQSIRDIMAIEGQLSRREADLDSLKQQQAWLAEQSSWSTITVHLKQKTAKDADTDETGFLAGLHSGWHAFTGASVAVITAVGALLPFTVLLVLVGTPLLILLRRRAGRRSSPPVAEAGPAGS